MDEPTAAISVRQVAEVLDLIRRLRDRGISVVLISHRMPDVFAVADRIAVLRRGSLVANKPAAGTSPEEITGLITGADRSRVSRETAYVHYSTRSSAEASTGALLSRLGGVQVFWVFLAAVLACLALTLLTDSLRDASATCSTSPATSPSSRSSRSA